MSVLRGVMLLWTALIAAPAEASGVFDDVSELKAAVDDVTTAEETHGPLAEWDVSRVDEMSATPYKFFPSNFDGDVSKWDTARVTTFYKTVSATPRRGAATGPSPAAHSAAPRRARLRRSPPRAARPTPPQFYKATSFNGDLSKWDTARVAVASLPSEHGEQFANMVSATPRRGGDGGGGDGEQTAPDQSLDPI